MLGFITLATALSVAPPIRAGLRLAQAEGAFPGMLVCSPTTSGVGGFRASVTVEIGERRARYTFAGLPGGGSEVGSGTLAADRTLVLNGKGRIGGTAYTSHYSGTVGGRGGTLTGMQDWPGGGRTCQLSLGDGRG